MWLFSQTSCFHELAQLMEDGCGECRKIPSSTLLQIKSFEQSFTKKYLLTILDSRMQSDVSPTKNLRRTPS